MYRLIRSNYHLTWLIDCLFGNRFLNALFLFRSQKHRKWLYQRMANCSTLPAIYIIHPSYRARQRLNFLRIYLNNIHVQSVAGTKGKRLIVNIKVKFVELIHCENLSRNFLQPFQQQTRWYIVYLIDRRRRSHNVMYNFEGFLWRQEVPNHR